VRHRHSRCNLSTKRLAGTIEGELHAEWITTTSPDMNRGGGRDFRNAKQYLLRHWNHCLNFVRVRTLYT
jgi:hypothetical protein